MGDSHRSSGLPAMLTCLAALWLSTTLAGNAATKALQLKGGIEDFSPLAAVQKYGLACSGELPRARIENIELGSPAALVGLRKGDVILKVGTELNTTVVLIERDGKRYQCQLKFAPERQRTVEGSASTEKLHDQISHKETSTTQFIGPPQFSVSFTYGTPALNSGSG